MGLHILHYSHKENSGGKPKQTTTQTIKINTIKMTAGVSNL
jgi:hypothetical protein